MKHRWPLLGVSALALAGLSGFRLVAGSSTARAEPAETRSASASFVDRSFDSSGALLVVPPELAPDFRAVDAAAERGIRQGIYPAAAVVIGRSDRILHAAGYGHFTWNARSTRPSPDSSIWDIASLTKVVGTTAATARLVDRGKLQLDAPVGRYVPAFARGDKGRVTLRMLLDHTSGLPAYVAFHKKTKSRDRAVEMLLAEPLRRTPGDSAVYSDLNMMLLGMVLERVTGQPLDTVVAREVFEPLGMRSTMYRPQRKILGRVVPTAVWRGHPISGEVNDPNAGVLGGVAGHAGLFATGSDLARFAQTWLRMGAGSKGRWIDSATVRRFLTPNRQAGSRLLGWDTRDTAFADPDDRSVFGERVSRDAYGHTGWTGVQLWIDPRQDIFVVFLTNRSYDPKKAESIEALRTIRADLANAAVGGLEVACRRAPAAARSC
jgi:CubicO group peptidase (beta-lactamase class C family)